MNLRGISPKPPPLCIQPAAQPADDGEPRLGRGLFRHPLLLRRRISGSRCKVSFQAVGQDLVLMFGGQTSTQAGGERSGRVIRLVLDDSELIRETSLWWEASRRKS